MAEKPEVLPNGVTLPDWDDFDHKRNAIFDSMKTAVSEQFPQVQNGVRLELHGLNYVDPETYSTAEQKEALLSNKFLHRRLRGTYKLFDDKTGELLDQKEATVMRVPYLTNRGTFIHNGSEITTANQSRLLPGVYTRRKSSGEVESHFNAKRGTGRSFRLRLEPESGLMKMDIGQSSLRLYSLLHDIGVSDEELEKRWGKELTQSNKDAYDPRVFEKAYSRLVLRPDPNHTREQKAQAIRDALAMTKLERGVLSRTLPDRVPQLEKSAAEGKAGCLMAVLSSDDAATIVEWAQSHIPSRHLTLEGLEKEIHVTVRYGWQAGASVSELKSFLKDYGSIRFTLGKLRRFAKVNGGKADALIIEVTSPDLVKLRKAIDDKFGEVLDKPTYPTYNPHLTLAYVAPGTCKSLDNHARFSGQTYVLKQLVYSTAGSKKKEVISL